MEFVKAGKVRALAVTTKTRLDALPDLPSANEFVPGYEAIGWYGIGTPKATPGNIVAKLNSAAGRDQSHPGCSATMPSRRRTCPLMRSDM